MINAFKQYVGIKLGNKKMRNVVLMYVIYAIAVLGPAFSNLSLGYTLIVILAAYTIFVTVFMPFTTWYLVHYKESEDK